MQSRGIIRDQSDGPPDHFLDTASFPLPATNLEVALGHEAFGLDARSAIKDFQNVTTP